MSGRNFYIVLGVAREASREAIRDAYLELAKRFHPDRVGPQGNAYFQEIVEAYRVLSDARQRASYDRGLRHARAEEEPARIVVIERGSGAQPLVRRRTAMGGPRRMRQPFDALLDEVFRAFASPSVRPHRPLQPVDAEVRLSPEQAAQGGPLELEIPVFSPCPRCQGHARRGGPECPRCGRDGVLRTWQTVEVAIPPSLNDGEVIEVPVRGLAQSDRFLRLHVRTAA